MPLDAARDGLIAVQAQLIEVLAARNAGLEARIGEMEERLARLERAVSRNSGNSSMPPSADDLPGRTAPGPWQARGGGKKRPGKQPGAPGSYLAWSKDPRDRVPLFPQGPLPRGRSRPRPGSAGDKSFAVEHCAGPESGIALDQMIVIPRDGLSRC
jgi:hypothetical protein